VYSPSVETSVEIVYGRASSRFTLNDFETQAVAQWRGRPTPQKRIRTEHSFDVLYPAKILAIPTKMSVPTHRQSTVFVSSETSGEVELMGKTHIRKFNLQRGHSLTSGDGKGWSRIPLGSPHVSLAWQLCPSPILRLLLNFLVDKRSGTSYVRVSRKAWKTKAKKYIPENPYTHQHWDASNVIKDNEEYLYGLWLDL